MRTMFLLLTVVLAPQLPALAEEKTHSGKIIVGSSSDYAYNDSSEVMRQPLTLAIGGYTSPKFGGYTLGYYLTPDLQIELEHRTVHGPSIEDGAFEWERKEKAIGLNGNFFFKNAWMIGFGILQRDARFTESFYWTRDWSPAYDLEIQRKDLAVRVKISSQWQWSSFYCGFDWISYEHRVHILSKSVTSHSMDGSVASQDRLNRANEDARTLLKSDVPITAFRIGFAF